MESRKNCQSEIGLSYLLKLSSHPSHEARDIAVLLPWMSSSNQREAFCQSPSTVLFLQEDDLQLALDYQIREALYMKLLQFECICRKRNQKHEFNLGSLLTRVNIMIDLNVQRRVATNCFYFVWVRSALNEMVNKEQQRKEKEYSRFIIGRFLHLNAALEFI